MVVRSISTRVGIYLLLEIVKMLQIAIFIITAIIFFWGRTYCLCTDSIYVRLVTDNLKVSHCGCVYNCWIM